MLMASLPTFRLDLDTLYATKNLQLLDALHKFYGGVCYANTPHLLASLQAFELNLQNGRDDHTEILYQNLVKSLDMLEKVYQSYN